MDKLGMVHCKYLDDLGLKVADYGTNFCNNKDKRWVKWQEERVQYGFDSRETWNIDYLLVEWIYTRFKMFVERANVDLEYYKFKLDDEEVTQLEAINLIVAECERLLLNKDDAKNRFNKKIWNLIVDILPHMWW